MTAVVTTKAFLILMPELYQLAPQDGKMKFKFGVQNLSDCRPGCHRSPKPSGERTIQRPPESPNAWPHAFSQGLMNVETPAPPGLVAPGRPRADSAPPLSRCPRRLAPHGQTRLLSIPVDSCRFVPSRTRPRPHAFPTRADSRAPGTSGARTVRRERGPPFPHPECSNSRAPYSSTARRGVSTVALALIRSSRPLSRRCPWKSTSIAPLRFVSRSP